MSLRLWLALVALAPGAVPSIDTFGSVRGLLERREEAGKVAIADVVRDPHAYALGALAGLRGEITVLDGTVWLSYPPPAPGRPSQVAALPSTPERAAFLAAAHVAPGDWRHVMLPDAVSSNGFDDAVERWAADHGLGGRPFVFRIDGRFESLTVATVDQRRLPPVPAPASEKQLAGANALQHVVGVDGALVGFYDPRGDGSIARVGAHSHVHVVVPAVPITGHAQSFALAPGAMLSLPMPR